MSDVQVTDSVFTRVAEILAAEGSAAALRVSVEGGGCSGFQYKFELDDQIAEDDRVYEKSGVRVLVDAVSLPFLAGSVIDYEDDLIGARFAIRNPNATSSCGCGTSFSL